MSATDPPLPLPSAPSFHLSESITIQPPLSRLAKGPGLVLVIDGSIPSDAAHASLDPKPLQKWAEEGYAMAQVHLTQNHDLRSDLAKSVAALKRLPEYDGNPKFGLISESSRARTIMNPDIYNITAYLSTHTSTVSEAINQSSHISAVVSYGSDHPSVKSKPHLLHSTAKLGLTPFKDTAKVHVYPTAESFFVLPSHPSFHSSSASLSHTRTLTFLKPIMGGPYFDLEAIWDEHTFYEFGHRSVSKTMSTMVQEPYVNHIPTITGGIGRPSLTNFYRDHFIFNNPDDTALELVSRTVGIDRVIDEFIFVFTHDKVIDWMVPGVPPTGKRVRVPFTSVVNIRGDRLYHEHISWDQATILVQLGLLPEYLPFPFPIDGKAPAKGKRFEYRVPAAGVETANKLENENALGSNAMFDFKVREVDDK